MLGWSGHEGRRSRAGRWRVATTRRRRRVREAEREAEMGRERGRRSEKEKGVAIG